MPFLYPGSGCYLPSRNLNFCKIWGVTILKSQEAHWSAGFWRRTVRYSEDTLFRMSLDSVTVCLTCPTSFTTICRSSTAGIPLKEYTEGLEVALLFQYSVFTEVSAPQLLDARCSSSIYNREQRTSPHNWLYHKQTSNHTWKKKYVSFLSLSLSPFCQRTSY